MWIDSQVLEKANQKICTKIFIPKKRQIVLGRSNSAETEVYAEKALEQGVPVTKRRGGGGTVLLYPGCVVVSVGAWMKERFCNDKYFASINKAILDLTQTFLDNTNIALKQKGISDLAIATPGPEGEEVFRKFCGTSLFRSRNYLLYQASILYKLSDEIHTLLRMPSKQPDYRKDRTHQDFLTDLSNYSEKTIEDYRAYLQQHLPSRLETHLHDQLIKPPEEQQARVLEFSKKTR